MLRQSAHLSSTSDRPPTAGNANGRESAPDHSVLAFDHAQELNTTIDLSMLRPKTAGIRNPAAADSQSATAVKSTHGLLTVTGTVVKFVVGSTWGDAHFVGKPENLHL